MSEHNTASWSQPINIKNTLAQADKSHNFLDVVAVCVVQSGT